MVAGVDIIISTLCNTSFCMALNNTPSSIWKFEDESLSIKAARGIENHYSLKKLAKELNGKHLKIATYINEPMSSAKPDPQTKGKLKGGGVAFYILNILRDKFNFTYDIVLAKKNLIIGGSEPEDSLIGLVSTEKADMAAAFVADILEFQKLVSFSIPFEEESWVMILKRPGESAVGEGLLAPFSDLVWYLILAALATFGPCIYIFTHVRAKLVSDDEPPVSLFRSVWFVYGTLIKQGTNLNPKANTTRVLFTTWWLFIMLLSAYYMANLTAFLTLSQFTLDIKGPRDLLERNYPWIAASGGVVEFEVTKPSGSMYYLNEMVIKKRGVFQPYISINDFLQQVDKGVVLIKSSATATHGLYKTYKKKIEQGVPEKKRCTYVVAQKPLMTNMRGFIYPKNSKLKTLFDAVLGIIIQSGIVEELKTLAVPKVNICPMDLQFQERKLQITDLIKTYQITATGICAAIAVFVGEIIFGRHISAMCKKRIKDKIKKTKCNKKSIVHHSQSKDADSPPTYDAIFGKVSKIILTPGAHKKVINGREYLVVYSQYGVRLIPIRTTSALLYKLGKN